MYISMKSKEQRKLSMLRITIKYERQFLQESGANNTSPRRQARLGRKSGEKKNSHTETS